MKKINYLLSLFMLVCVTKIFAQEPKVSKEENLQSFEYQVKTISSNIEAITKEEKLALKSEVEAVNVALEKGKITKEESDEKKLKLATSRAKIIEDKVTVEEEKLKKLIQQKVEGRISSQDSLKKSSRIMLKFDFKEKDSTKIKSEKRTTSQFVYAIGINNLASNNSISNSGMISGQSRFYEWGVTFNSRILPNHNLLHFKYGMSLMYNDLKSSGNRFFVDNGGQTVLQTNALTQKEARFRNVNLVFPFHLEFDFTKPNIKDGKTNFKSHESVRLGIGGFFGANLKSKQLIKYDSNGYNTEEKTKGDFNTNTFVYGLSTYIGYKSTSLYLKYDLNPLFKNNTIDQNNVSLGLRFDFN